MPAKKTPKKVKKSAPKVVKVQESPIGAGFAHKDTKATQESAFEKMVKESGCSSAKHFATKVISNPTRWAMYLDDAHKVMGK